MSKSVGESHIELKENKEIEFKEVWLIQEQIKSSFSKEQIYNIILNGIFTEDIDKFIYNSVANYTYKVILKYLSCFGNAKINGKIYIGVSDDGIITGIPTISYQNLIKIKTKLETQLQNDVKSNTSSKNLLEKIKIKIVKLKKDLSILFNESEILLKKYSEIQLKYNEDLQNYNQQNKQWQDLHEKYAQKLNKLVNIPSIRKELIQFIEINENCSIKVISLLKSQILIYINLDQIELDKKNKDTIFYWIAKFRDSKLNKLNKERKKINLLKPHFPTKTMGPSLILSNIPSLAYLFIKNNETIEYYYLEIDILGKELIDASPISWFDHMIEKWMSRCRINDTHISNGPMCIEC